MMDSSDTSRHEQAGQWFAVLHRGMMTIEERTALADWKRDPENVRALRRLEEVWSGLGSHDISEEEAGWSRRQTLRVAASLAAVMVGSSATFSVMSHAREKTITTGVGEQKTLTLEDGSIVFVNVDTMLRYHFTSDWRAITLMRGDALFTVAKDKARPFIVTVGALEARAVGTEFSVSLRTGHTHIAVRQGLVTISDTGKGPAARPQMVKAGWAWTAGPARIGRSAKAEPIALQRIGEWRTRVVTYEDVSLGEVIDDLHRYFPGRIILTDAGLKQQRVTLRLPLQQQAETIETLAKLLSLSPDVQPDGSVRLSRAAE